MWQSVVLGVMAPIGRIAALTRYPVKSMAGESLQQASLTPDGMEQDRLYAFASSGAPPGMLRVTGQERRELLRYKAQMRPDGRVEILTPPGEALPVEAAALLRQLEALAGHAFTLTQEDVPQTDVRPLSLLSLQTVDRLSEELGQQIDARRFRANLLLDLPGGAFCEDELVGKTLRLGADAVIAVSERDPRCRFITYDPDAPGTTEPLFALMKLLDRRHQGRAGVYASVVVPGEVRVSDVLQML